MSQAVGYGSKQAADNARDQWADYVCPVDDDRRLKMVHYVSDVPDGVMARIEADADEDRAARDDTTGQADLTDAEKGRIDFSRGRANVPWARSIKALAEQYGVSDWTAHLDHTLNVDEHRSLMPRVIPSDADRADPTGDAAGSGHYFESSPMPVTPAVHGWHTPSSSAGHRWYSSVIQPPQ